MTVTTAIPRLTVAIPLYRGSRWDNNIIRNIQRIPQDARIILSDEVSSDRTAEVIAGPTGLSTTRFVSLSRTTLSHQKTAQWNN